VRKHLHAMSSAPEGGIAAGGVSAPNALTDDCCLSFHVPAPPWLTGPRPGSPVVWVSEHVSHPVGESTHGVGVGSVHAVLNDVCQFVRKPCYIAPVLRIERSGEVDRPPERDRCTGGTSPSANEPAILERDVIAAGDQAEI